MSNYFEYQDFAKVDRSAMGLSTAESALQAPSNLNDLKNGVEPYDYASFEEGKYITSKPKRLIKDGDKVGLLTNSTQTSFGVTITLEKTYTMSGITLGLVNIPDSLSISYYGETGGLIREETFTREDITENLYFFNMASEGVKKVSLYFNLTTKKQFVGLYRIDFGSVRIFNDENLINASVENFYSKLGDTLEYDIMNATIFVEGDTEYLFTKSQPIVYKSDTGEKINQFFVETGETANNNTIKIKAYDVISRLEDKFMGGIYGFPDTYTGEARPPYPYNQLIADIIGDSGVEYETQGTDDISVNGFLPISTRREALVTLMQGTNTRCYKQGGKLTFKPIDLTEVANYTDNDIVVNPTSKSTQKIGKLTFVEHTYTKSNDEVELFNWYLQQGENTGQIIEFSEPVWKVRAYEVTGTDPDTELDIVSETESQNVIFATSPQDEGDETVCNYVEIQACRTSNKIVLVGWSIIDHGKHIEVDRTSKDVNAEYEEIEIDDVTVVSNAKEVAKTLFTLNSLTSKETFSVVEVDRPIAGNNVTASIFESPVEVNFNYEGGEPETKTISRKIVSVKDDLSGVYKVVAE